MNETIKRSISGVICVLAVVAGLIINKFLYAGLLVFMMVTMMGEFYRMTLGKRYQFSRMLAILAGLVIFALLFSWSAYHIPLQYLSFTMLPLFIVMINSLYVSDKHDFWRFSHIYVGLLYIAVPLALSNLIVFQEQEFNGMLLLCFFVIIWSSDVGGFVFGSTLGKIFKKKLFPEISPKKSWAGFWGGIVLAIAASLVMKQVGWLEYPVIHCVLLAIVMNVAGVYGDLFESQWKRCYEIKDSGHLIPGHGGMLDRFDSTLFAVPAGVMYLVLCGL